MAIHYSQTISIWVSRTQSEMPTLYTGAHMPAIGLGTWKSKSNDVYRAVKHALQNGYRHIDCAPAYANEKEVGRALTEFFAEQSEVKREDIFVTTKLWNKEHGNVKNALEKSLADLNLTYVDLYHVHWPLPFDPEFVMGSGEPTYVNIPLHQCWKDMEAMVDLGLAKHIGVSNSPVALTFDLLLGCRIKPAVVQVELQPYGPQNAFVDWHLKKGIVVTGHSPLGTPDFKQPSQPSLMRDPKLVEIAAEVGCSSAQLLIAWAIGRRPEGMVSIPKSVTPSRIDENLAAGKLKLSPEIIEKVNALDRNYRFLNPVNWGWGIPLFD